MNPINQYFQAEQTESVAFIVIGLLAIILSVGLYLFYRNRVMKGFMFPMILVAVIQLTVGIEIYFRSPQDIERVSGYLEQDISKIDEIEIPRMEVVMANFVYYRWVEISLIIIAAGLIIFGRNKSILLGIGIGLIIQSTTMLYLDLLAESRGVEYIQYLEELSTEIDYGFKPEK